MKHLKYTGTYPLDISALQRTVQPGEEFGVEDEVLADDLLRRDHFEEAGLPHRSKGKVGGSKED